MALVVTAKLATGQVAEANIAADKLVAFSPSMGSLTLRALARQAVGDRPGALSDFQQAIALMEAEVKNRRNAETLETFAWALSKVDRRQEAQVVIE